MSDKEFYYIGSSPYEEDCAQTVNQDFTRQNRRECLAYIELLTRQFGPPPGSAHFVVKTEDHDFGMYREVVIYFDPAEPEEVEYADQVENGLPQWDEEAKKNLGL